jgi:hypothetical protein
LVVGLPLKGKVSQPNPSSFKVDGDSSFCAFRNRYRNEQDITRGITCYVNTRYTALFGERVVDYAALFIAFAGEPFPQV